ncbi:hypothetical protein [Brevundimonas sp.]|uniref:hypothetical protein n=1 Tax=Brevundimonas sp. TaxID=1871086 RepID=UPI0028AEF6C5|nr:hypothetical protein [Brevundimonas sp.]
MSRDNVARPGPPSIRAGSKHASQVRHLRYSREEGVRFIAALERYAETLRKPGQRTGAAGTISFGAVRLAQVLMRLAVKYNGRVEPSVAWLAKQLNVACKSIHAWKGQLADHGFLRWERRYIHVGLPRQRGPQLKQTSNAYRLSLPKKAAELITHIWRFASTASPMATRGSSVDVQRLIREGCDAGASEIRKRESPEASLQSAPLIYNGFGRFRPGA